MKEIGTVRVLHVIPGISPRYGGPSTVIGPMVAALNRLPHIEAEIATTDADGPGSRIDPGLIRQWGVPVHVFRRTFSERWKFSIDLWRWLRRRAGEFDLLHIHSLWSFASAAAARASLRASVPYIIRPAGMLSPYTWTRGTWNKRLYWSCAERATAFGAAAFHVTSDEEADEVRAVRPDATTFVIPNGIDGDAWTSTVDPSWLRTRCGPIADGRPIVLFLSRLHPKKGIIELLLPAVDRMKTDACLAVIGGPDPHAPEYEREVGEQIRRLGLTNRVALLGPATAADRWRAFDGADLFVLPSRSENFGVVVAEAMARGCAVVVTDGVQAKVHVEAADAGRIVPPEPAALAGALDELLADAATRREMGGRGQAYVRNRLDWDSIAQSIAACYAECVAKQKHRPPAAPVS